MLRVITPAPDPWLLTLAQMKELAGVTDTSRDEELEAMRASISARIYDAVNVTAATGGEPTLRQETLEQRLLGPASGPLILSRRHDVELVSIDGWLDGTDIADYFVDPEAGLVHRPGRRQWGCSGGGCGYVTVVYKAGFENVPPSLYQAAAELARLRLSESSRDPYVKRESVDVDGIERIEQEFWVTAAGSTEMTSTVPPTILATLKRYRNSVYA